MVMSTASDGNGGTEFLGQFLFPNDFLAGYFSVSSNVLSILFKKQTPGLNAVFQYWCYP